MLPKATGEKNVEQCSEFQRVRIDGNPRSYIKESIYGEGLD